MFYYCGEGAQPVTVSYLASGLVVGATWPGCGCELCSDGVAHVAAPFQSLGTVVARLLTSSISAGWSLGRIRP